MLQTHWTLDTGHGPPATKRLPTGEKSFCNSSITKEDSETSMMVHICNHSRLRQEDGKFQASLGFIARPGSKINKTERILHDRG
jgi:hypothetical protein